MCLAGPWCGGSWTLCSEELTAGGTRLVNHYLLIDVKRLNSASLATTSHPLACYAMAPLGQQTAPPPGAQSERSPEKSARLKMRSLSAEHKPGRDAVVSGTTGSEPSSRKESPARRPSKENSKEGSFRQESHRESSSQESHRENSRRKEPAAKVLTAAQKKAQAAKEYDNQRKGVAAQMAQNGKVEELKVEFVDEVGPQRRAPPAAHARARSVSEILFLLYSFLPLPPLGPLSPLLLAQCCGTLACWPLCLPCAGCLRGAACRQAHRDRRLELTSDQTDQAG